MWLVFITAMDQWSIARSIDAFPWTTRVFYAASSTPNGCPVTACIIGFVAAAAQEETALLSDSLGVGKYVLRACNFWYSNRVLPARVHVLALHSTSVVQTAPAGALSHVPGATEVSEWLFPMDQRTDD